MTGFSKYHPDKGMPLGRILKLPTGDPLAMMRAFARHFTEHAGEGDLICIIIDECDTLADEILAGPARLSLILRQSRLRTVDPPRTSSTS